MAAMLAYRRFAVPAGVLLAIVALVLIQQFGTLPGNGRVAAGLENAAHGPWFALLIFLVHLLARRVSTARTALLVSALAALVLAPVTEALQIVTIRDADLRDVGFDLLGAAAALAFLAGRNRPGNRAKSLTVAASLLTLSLLPGITALGVQAYRNMIFPELVSFAVPWWGGLLEANSPVAVVAPPTGWSEAPNRVLKVTLADTRWPGVILPEPAADWSRFAVLEVDLFTPVAIEVRVSVRLANAPTDHVYRTFALSPGAQQLIFPIASTFDASKVRVTAVVIYTKRRFAGHVIYLGGVRLVGAGPEMVAN